MSFAALNQPAAVAAAGAGALVLLPFAENLVASGVFSWQSVKGAAAAAYFVQVVAVSIPGRIDDDVAKAIREEQESGNASSKVNAETEASAEGKNLAPKNGRTLLPPAAWAFAIWGPIFLGELAYVTSQYNTPASHPLVPLLRKTAVPFTFAHIFQSLWCCSFRRKYSGKLAYISFGLLSATAFSLSRAHAAYTSPNTTNYSAGTYIKMFLPITMHCGWTVAASLVNLNGAFSMKMSNSPRAIAILGHLSAALASVAGVLVTFKRSAPIFGGVISWALLAVADGMTQRLQSTRINDDDEGESSSSSNVVGASTQRLLCLFGAAASAVATVITSARIFYSARNGRISTY